MRDTMGRLLRLLQAESETHHAALQAVVHQDNRYKDAETHPDPSHEAPKDHSAPNHSDATVVDDR